MSFNYKSITPLTSNLSKLEKYKEKLKERQIFNNNFFERFNDIGGGSPLRNRDGSLKTKRVSMLNENYEDIYFEKNRRQMEQNNNNNNNIYNNQNYGDNMFMNMNEFQKLQYQIYLQMKNQQQNLQRSRSPNVNIYNRNPYYQIDNNFNNNLYNQFQQYIINNNTYGNYQNMDNFNYKNTYLGNMNNNSYNYNYNDNSTIKRGNFHYNQNPQLLNDLNTNKFYQKIPNNIKRVNPDFNQNINEYNGIGIIPRDRFDENIERQKKNNLRNEWIREMNENKIRKEERKLREMELDQKADEKWRRELEQEIIEEKMKKEREKEKYIQLENHNQSSILQNFNVNRVKSPYDNI